MKKLFAISAAALAALMLAAVAFAANTTYTLKLTGPQEVPKGAPKGTGTAKITLMPKAGKVCFNITWKGIATPTASHIHSGKKGVAGPVVIPLFATPPKHKACVKASKSLITKIQKSPKSYYINVHNKQYPNGAIRSQL